MPSIFAVMHMKNGIEVDHSRQATAIQQQSQATELLCNQSAENYSQQLRSAADSSVSGEKGTFTFIYVFTNPVYEFLLL